MPRRAPALASLGLAPFVLATGLYAQSASCYDTSPIDRKMQDILKNVAPNGAALVLSQNGTEIFSKTYGRHTLDEQLKIFSSSKWLLGAVIMSLVDDKKLSLDDTAGKYFSSYGGDHAKMTVRQLMSHTGGFGRGGQNWVGNSTVTLQGAAVELGKVTLAYKPGTALHYGPVNMHVAGAIAELAGGKSFEALFQERIAKPLGMTKTTFGTTTNPAVARGAVSSVRDYNRFLLMLANKGLFGTTRVLSAAAVDEMFKKQTGAAKVVSTFHKDNRLYGIGCWRDRVDGQGNALQLSSQGAQGFSPWIDLERNVAAMYSAKRRLSGMYDSAHELQAVTRGVLHFVGVDCYGRATPTCATDLRFWTNRAPRAGDAGFALGVRGAPANAPCLVMFAATPKYRPLALLGISLYVVPTVDLGLRANASGTIDLPFSLAPATRGMTGAVQWLALDRNNCGGDLRATSGIELTVQ